MHLGSVEDVLDGQHGDDGEHLLTAAQVDGHDEHLTLHGLQGELSHLEEREGDQREEEERHQEEREFGGQGFSVESIQHNKRPSSQFCVTKFSLAS